MAGSNNRVEMAVKEQEVVAAVGMKPPAPWLLLESSTFAGRCYFFNTTTLESKWSLPQEVFAERTMLSTVVSDDAPINAVSSSLAAAKDAVERMSVRYRVSMAPSETTSVHREPKLDPRLASIVMEEHLMSAIKKAENFDKQWSEVSVLERIKEGKRASRMRTADDGDELPSPESFAAIRDFAGADGAGGAIGGRREVDSASLYTVVNGLGSGGYSNVILAQHTQRLELVAIKVLSKKLLQQPGDRTRLRNELCALTAIPPSPFIQRCFAAFESPSHVCFD